MLASLATLGAISHHSAMHTSSMPLFAGENSEMGVVWEPRPRGDQCLAVSVRFVPHRHPTRLTPLFSVTSVVLIRRIASRNTDLQHHVIRF